MLHECLLIKGEAFVDSNKGVHAECTHIALYSAFTYRLVRTAKQKQSMQLSEARECMGGFKARISLTSQCQCI